MDSDRVAGRVGATNAAFPTSCWTAVLSLRQSGGETVQQDALNALCNNYWFPLYAFARHRGMTCHDSEDAVQSFFLAVGDAGYFEKAEKDRGKLRTFILTGFTRHLKDLKVRANALKRGGGVAQMSIDTDQAEEWLLLDPKSVDESATHQFERHWACNIIRKVTEGLREQASKSPESVQRFEVLSRFLNPETCYDYTGRQAAEDLGMSEAACEKAIQRLRNSFRVAVREQVAATLDNPTEEAIMEEMLQLQKALISR
ncbi:MAG: RNA polymerase sigma factor [Verrucomicrobiaceae bacterium]